ncbi:hypothetical protein ASD78_17790 [Lysobacter sp. Root667]|nr:hypothetical protein ASD78_17790 [Lysobacter sp. Root667]
MLARVEVPLAIEAVAEQRISSSLRLHVQNYGESVGIEVLSNKPVAGCFENLAHRWPHGPDPSEIMAWHVTEHYYEEPRLISVCGRSLTVKVELVGPQVSEDGKRFLSGTAVVTVQPSKRVSRRGT